MCEMVFENICDFWIVLPFWITLKYKAHPVHLLPPSLWVTVAYGSLSRMITKKDQGGAVGFDSHYRSRPFRIPYKSNLCTNIIMIHNVAKKFPKWFQEIYRVTEKTQLMIRVFLLWFMKFEITVTGTISHGEYKIKHEVMRFFLKK